MKALRIPAKIRAEKLEQCPFCVFCHTDKDLELNHVNPDLPPTIDNLMVLCSKCHMEKWHLEPTTRRHADMVRRGIKEAKERGVHFGKPHADYEKIMRLIAENSTQFNDIYDADYEPKTEHEIMEMAGRKNSCYNKCKRMLIEAMQANIWPFAWQKPKHVKNRPMYEHVIRKIRGD